MFGKRISRGRAILQEPNLERGGRLCLKFAHAPAARTAQQQARERVLTVPCVLRAECTTHSKVSLRAPGPAFPAPRTRCGPRIACPPLPCPMPIRHRSQSHGPCAPSEYSIFAQCSGGLACATRKFAPPLNISLSHIWSVACGGCTSVFTSHLSALCLSNPCELGMVN